MSASPSTTTVFAAWRGLWQADTAAWLAVAGFTAGHACLPNHWLHLGWLLVGGIAAIGLSRGKRECVRPHQDAGAVLIAVFLLWMTLRSVVGLFVAPTPGWQEPVRGFLGLGMLCLLIGLLWRMASDDPALRLCGWVTGMVSGFAALLSVLLTSFVLPDHHASERLTNLLVHGGLNPVCTGLTFGFAALWLAALIEKDTMGLSRQFAWSVIVLLHLATFWSGSRGAMLALASGHLALLIARGWRRGAPAVFVLLLTGTIYFSSAPLMARLESLRQTSQESAPGLAHHLEEAVARADNGRFDIYRAGWNALDNLWLGTGQWGVRDVWQCELQPDPCGMMTHLHSAFFATFVHGGLIGAALLIALLALAWRSACRLAVGGDATWVALLAFGCGGLLFDGESLTSLATAPRFEGLLFWLPLTVALARGRLTLPPSGS